MRQSIIIAMVLVAAFAITAGPAAAGNGYGQTENWTGFRWARDDDGDGIPNGLDPDWTRPRDGTGYGAMSAYLGPMLLGAMDQNQIQTRTRTRTRTFLGESVGDMIRKHLRSRDGSCTS